MLQQKLHISVQKKFIPSDPMEVKQILWFSDLFLMVHLAAQVLNESHFGICYLSCYYPWYFTSYIAFQKVINSYIVLNGFYKVLPKVFHKQILSLNKLFFISVIQATIQNMYNECRIWVILYLVFCVENLQHLLTQLGHFCVDSKCCNSLPHLGKRAR